jgi:chemotaxis family two-component system response regulator Rcp1
MVSSDFRAVSPQASAKRRILLAEDNPADVYLLQEALALPVGGAVELVVVRDGEEALNYIHHKQPYEEAPSPDLIILDLNLPKSDGGDVLRAIRIAPHLQRIPVVVLTSSESPRDRALAEKLGANRYVTKPVDLDEFLALGDVLLSYLP